MEELTYETVFPYQSRRGKKIFFFIDASVNATHIQFGNLENRDSDPDPELTVVEHNVFKRLITN